MSTHTIVSSVSATILTELGIHRTSQTAASRVVGADCLSKSHEVAGHSQNQRCDEEESRGGREKKGNRPDATHLDVG